MGETRVDILHLLEDLRDAYPGGLEETILTEIVANALDSGATVVELAMDAAAATLTVTDDGVGMARAELRRFHDIAATTKTRGQGIGFAGVGIKLGLLAAADVLTETRRGSSHVASSWQLATRRRAPWNWVPPPGLVGDHGTAVRLTLREPLSALLDAGYVEATLRRHFEPLLDPFFDAILAPQYPAGVRFVVNGRDVSRSGEATGRAPITVRLGRRRKPSALGYLFRADAPLAEEQRGVAVATLGKVIRRGWDWLGLSPAAADEVCGVIEIPALAECLQLNKADFIRSGARGQTYLAYRKALQQAITTQLAAWGDTRGVEAEVRRRKARPLERDLERVLVDLADAFPLLATLVERHAGGQRRLPMGRSGHDGAPGPAALEATPEATGEAPSSEAPVEPSRAGEPPATPPPSSAALMPEAGPRGPRRPAHYGLRLQFESRPGHQDLGRLVESTVWVNEAHPAWRRAVASKAEGYHLALTVAMALAPLAVEPAQAHGFVTAFLARWGEAVDGAKGRRRG